MRNNRGLFGLTEGHDVASNDFTTIETFKIVSNYTGTRFC
jgi:hypothetical protein